MSAPTDSKPSPLFFNSARGSRQSPFGRPGSIRQGSPAAARPATPNASPLKPKDKDTPATLSPSSTPTPAAHARNNSQTAPPWLKSADRPASPSLLREPASPAPHLRSPSTEPLSPAPQLRPASRGLQSPGPQLLSPARDRIEFPRNPSTSTNATLRPHSTASLAARFDGARERSSTPPLLQPPALSKPLDKAIDTPIFAEPETTTKPLGLAIETPALAKPLDTIAKRSEAPIAVAKPARPPMIRQTTNDALSKLPPPLLHSMRESFSVMDRDDDGHVNAADVADMLSQLGLSATPSTLAAYFNGAQSINLATYLNTLSDLLGGLSRPNELIAAFEAFDDGDDGQIDLAELKDAMLHTAPDAGGPRLTEREIDMVVEGFSGRRAFGKGGKGLGRGEVFRYQEFMASLTGGSGENGAPAAA